MTSDISLLSARSNTTSITRPSRRPSRAPCTRYASIMRTTPQTKHTPLHKKEGCLFWRIAYDKFFEGSRLDHLRKAAHTQQVISLLVLSANRTFAWSTASQQPCLCRDGIRTDGRRSQTPHHRANTPRKPQRRGKWPAIQSSTAFERTHKNQEIIPHYTAKPATHGA